jgi:SAM-dependent methyltransferase
MKCRFCASLLTHQFVDLVNSPPSNDYLSAEDLNAPEVYLPLKLFVCDQCLLVQLDEYKKADQLFSKEYAYFSSYSTSWLAHSKRYTDEMITRFGFGSQSLVVEIASNDGYLLQYFKERNVTVLGIEPTESTATVARQKGIETLTEFFGINFAYDMVKEKGKADLLLGNNVLAHVPDINDFVGGMKIALKEQGVITVEFPHLLQLVWNNQFDTIYHEHFSYLSFTTVKKIFEAHGLEMFDVQEISTHGGSLRIFARHIEDQSKSVLPSVSALLEKEKQAGLTTPAFYDGFQVKVDQVKIDFLKFLVEKKTERKKVVAYGAAAKGNTLLNYCGVRHDLINFVVDASPHKQGKFLPGSHIPVVNEARIRDEKPDYIIILPWNIKEEIVNQLSYVKEWGCKFVMAIPQIEIIEL